MTLEAALVDVLEKLAPPGRTSFSVSVAADCAPAAPTCEGARQSTFYGAWVRQETKEEAQLRYAIIATALVSAGKTVLCLTEDGKKIEGCEPYRSTFRKQRWGVRYVTLAAIGAATYESGFREDVQMGRGHARKPSDDGGRGRGPGGEACLMQIHPAVAWRFAPDIEPELLARAKRGDRAARELVAQSLLGDDPEQLQRCFVTGMRMLIHARAYCAWDSPKTEGAWAMYARYGTGDSCTSSNHGKTVLRERLYESLVFSTR